MAAGLHASRRFGYGRKAPNRRIDGCFECPRVLPLAIHDGTGISAMRTGLNRRRKCRRPICSGQCIQKEEPIGHHKQRRALNIVGLNAMRTICVRNLQYLDTDSLAPCHAREALIRDQLGFLLCLSKERSSPSEEERIVRLGAREALIWLNEDALDHGSFWVWTL
jgi:hypothetical protein